jgi:hypothetical protein
MLEQRNPLEALVALYNSLQQAKPELGRLIVEGDFAKPSVVLFVPPHTSSPTSDFQMKAFPLKGIPEKEWDNLVDRLRMDLRNLAEAQRTTPSGLGQRAIQITLHRDTGLLVVLGPPSFLDAADSFVTAWHANDNERRASQGGPVKGKTTGEQ